MVSGGLMWQLGLCGIAFQQVFEMTNPSYVPNLMKTGFGNSRGMLLHTEGLVEKNS
jgi:hypothetical protein